MTPHLRPPTLKPEASAVLLKKTSRDIRRLCERLASALTGDIVEENFQINDISDQCHSLAASAKKEKQDEVNQTFVPSK